MSKAKVEKRQAGKKVAHPGPSRTGRATKRPLSLTSPQIVDYIARFAAAQIGGARVSCEIDATLGIPERTGKTWRALPGFWDAVHAQVKEFLASQVGPVSAQLAEDAISGDARARSRHQELFFKLRGDLSERVEHSGGLLVDLAAIKPGDAPGRAGLVDMLLAAAKKKELK